MGRLSATAKAAFAKGYTKGGADEPYLVLELALPGETWRLGIQGVSSDARGGIEPRIVQWGTLAPSIDLLTYGLVETEAAPEFDDADENPALRRRFARMMAKYPNQIRRSAATIRVISPDIPDVDSFVAFTGILDGADQIAPMRWRLRLRNDDGPLRSTAGKTGAVPRVPLARYFDGIDASASGGYAPIIYGVHSSSGSGGKGFVPCLLVDSANAKYLVSLGHIKTVTAVFEDGVLVPAGNYTITFETVKGALFTFIDFTTNRKGVITADVEGLTVNADGTGALITDPGAAMLHILVNFGFGDWRGGSAYLANGSAPIDATSFTNVGAYLTTMGYEASFYLDGEQQTTILQVFSKWLFDHALYAQWTNLGKLMVKFLDYRPPTTIYPTDPIIEGDVDELGAFQTPFDTSAIERELTVNYLLGDVESKRYQTLKVSDLSVAERITASIDLDWVRASLL